MGTKVESRQFNKETSIFKPWKEDTTTILDQAYSEDIKYWKGHRFIKAEDDRLETEAVLKKYYTQLKAVFLHVSASSAWPNISSLDFCDFASKTKI